MKPRLPILTWLRLVMLWVAVACFCSVSSQDSPAPEAPTPAPANGNDSSNSTPGLTHDFETGDRATLSENPLEGYRCSPIYGSGSTYNSYRPAQINVTFPTGQSGGVSVVIFNWLDQLHLGVQPFSDTTTRLYVCNQEAIDLKLCTDAERGQMLITSPETAGNPIHTEYVDLTKAAEASTPFVVSYTVNETGIYCVDVMASTPFHAESLWINPYGNLPAMDFPKLLFYGMLALVYLVVGLTWLVGTVRFWREILPVQNYLSLLILCLLLNYAVEFWFYAHYNTHGTKSMALATFLIILSSLRNCLSFFMMLIVALGYGVVKPTLGSTMRKCQILGGVYFLFSCIYGAATVGRFGNNDAAIIGLFAIIPLAITMATFYMWILLALGQTVKVLHQRHQHFKLAMYRRLWRLLFFCACMILVMVAVNIISFVFRNDDRWVGYRWRIRWILFDGWLTLLYTFAFLVILYLWRPTQHNSRYGLEELASDELTADAREDFSPGNSPTFAAATFRGSTSSPHHHRLGRLSTGFDPTAAGAHDPAIVLREFASPTNFSDFLDPDDDDDDNTSGRAGEPRRSSSSLGGYRTSIRPAKDQKYAPTALSDPDTLLAHDDNGGDHYAAESVQSPRLLRPRENSSQFSPSHQTTTTTMGGRATTSQPSNGSPEETVTLFDVSADNDHGNGGRHHRNHGGARGDSDDDEFADFQQGNALNPH
ncbi:hypothetical protein H4R34_003977 [Dimargaris verticillata]|uniref:Lung seven transmembrane receptor-domain-containing protein n=1 Tax=Dimargaris verticillata TaxID=2761393 RepID=A0A9W8B1C4_9FUNG|nr:hypothetical protein H4R34_003977 [Dimargaris verticillata]